MPGTVNLVRTCSYRGHRGERMTIVLSADTVRQPSIHLYLLNTYAHAYRLVNLQNLDKKLLYAVESD